MAILLSAAAYLGISVSRAPVVGEGVTLGGVLTLLYGIALGLQGRFWLKVGISSVHLGAL